MTTFQSATQHAVKSKAINEYARWYQAGIDLSDIAGGKYAAQRVQNEIFTPQLIPKFRVSPESEIFFSGSCFARGFENAAVSRELSVISQIGNAFQGIQTIRGGLTPAGFTNKYNSYAIANELNWAVNPDVDFPVQSLIEVEEDKWIDPHTNPTLQYLDYPSTLNNREILFSIVKKIIKAKLVFLSLTLNEVWYDNLTGHFLNITPLPAMLRQYPGRYSFKIIKYPQLMESLAEISSFFDNFGHPDVKILTTVCPVPMVATFTGQDVVLANTYCKSVLKAAIQDWAAQHDNVDYFPCYEVALYSNPKLFYIEDRRHVHGKLAHYFVDLLQKNYFS